MDSQLPAAADRPSRLHAALWALEHDDLAGWRANVDALIQWRSQPLVQGLARLARELEQALGEGTGGHSSGSLPEACVRLEHVVRVSEDASHRTLDTPHGAALGASYRWPTGQYCAIHTHRGFIGCGIYDVRVAGETVCFRAEKGAT